VAARRFDGYVRVSRVAGREGDSYISPTVQREAIQRWATYHEVDIVAWHVDEDQSGTTQKRPGLREAMRRVEARETDGIACARIDRFARNVSAAIEDIQRIQAVGAELAFVEEGIDCRGPFGDFMLTIMLAVATLTVDNLKASWKTAKQRAVDRGAKIGPCPFGYQRQDDGTLLPHPTEAAIVRQAYQLAASSGLRAAADYLETAATGRDWDMSRARRVFVNRCYLGENRNGNMIRLDAHEPLASRAVWEAAQHAPMIARGPSRGYPLSGFAVCGTCGGRMVGGTAGSKQRTYRCAASLTKRREAEKCPRGAMILAATLETHVREGLREALRTLPRGVVGEPQDDLLAIAEQAVVEAEAELDAFAADLTMRRVLGERYHEHLTARASAVDDARMAYRDRAVAAHAQIVVHPVEMLDGSPAEFSLILRGILASIVVQPGRGDVEGRVRLVPLEVDWTAGVPGAE
jgi:DNA invertase Pin-like site-specific DNA recombinase